MLVLWLAREGTYIREAKNGRRSFDLLVEAFDRMLAHDKEIRLAIEPKPNEPMDHAYIPTIGHALAIAQLTRDPKRVGCLIESAHAILAGLDPADEIDFACAFGKLWSLHLNDQNGLKYDQDKPFGMHQSAQRVRPGARARTQRLRQERRVRLLRRASVPHHHARALDGPSRQQPPHLPPARRKGAPSTKRPRRS